MEYYLTPIKLDDGQVLQGNISDFTHHELLSLANHYLKNKQKPQYFAIMAYQHKKFIKTKPFSPEAA